MSDDQRNGTTTEPELDAVVGRDPRQEALELLDGAWTTRLVEAEQDGSTVNLAAAQITGLIYIGDQIGRLVSETETMSGRLRDGLRDELPFAGRGNS